MNASAGSPRVDTTRTLSEERRRTAGKPFCFCATLSYEKPVRGGRHGGRSTSQPEPQHEQVRDIPLLYMELGQTIYSSNSR